MNPTDAHAKQDAESFMVAAVAEHESALRRYATRLVGDPHRAHDIVQDTFLKLLGRPVDDRPDELAPWLFTVCRHRALDVLRKEGRMSRFAEGEVERLPATELRPGRALEAAETQHALLGLIDRLPPNQQEVIRLKFQNGFSYKQISGITELSVSNVGFLIHTAVQRLRREFAAQQP